MPSLFALVKKLFVGMIFFILFPFLIKKNEITAPTRAWNIFLSWKVRTPPSQAPLVKKEGMFLYAWFILCS